MKVNYLIRLDDASPYMNSKLWTKLEEILDKYGVKPLVGIIPADVGSKAMIEPEDDGFWDKTRRWQAKGWCMALHGYDHVCISDEGLKGLNPVWKRSEFAGVPLKTQKEKIRKGVAILKEHGINAKYFIAPSHTFDKNTLTALKEESDIRIISDTIALKPYQKDGFVFIPQFSEHCVAMPLPGVFTFCFHPNKMSESTFVKLEEFLKGHLQDFIGFNDIDLSEVTTERVMDKAIRGVYFMMRRLKGRQ